MADDALGRLVAPAPVIAEAMALATLRPDPDAEPYYDEILVEFDSDGLSTPAGSTSSSLPTYCSASADRFDRLETVDDRAITAVFEIEEFTEWLRWIDDGSAVEVQFVGDVETGVVAEFHLSAGGLTAVVDCYRDPELLDSLAFELPSRFGDDDRFLLENGDPAPVLVETTARAMRRIVGAVDRVRGVEYYPFRIENGELRLDVEGRTGQAAHGRLPGEVLAGADLRNEYDGEFPAVFRCLSGEIELQTGPDEPLIVVRRGDGYTLRYVIMPVVW